MTGRVAGLAVRDDKGAAVRGGSALGQGGGGGTHVREREGAAAKEGRERERKELSSNYF